MTHTFKQMLRLLGAAINGVPFSPERGADIPKLRSLAISQSVWPLVYSELEKQLGNGAVKAYETEFLETAADGLQRSYFQLETISELNALGIKCCLLKGAHAASCYPHPELRISSDADILIDPKNEEQAIEFLRKKGYDVKERAQNDHHAKAYHPVGGLLEVHVRLYSIPTEQLVLDGLDLYREEWRLENTDGYDMWVLGVNDGLMYLTAHYIKHLVNEGGGIRQMLDLLLYIKKYKNQIDFDAYKEMLVRLKYDKLIDVVKTAGAVYWGFDYPVKYPELADKLLSDSEEGGIFGFDREVKNGFYSLYCQKRRGSVKAQALMYLKGETRLIRRIFPSKLHMLQCGYAYAKHTFLLPLAYLHRIADKLLKRDITSKARAADDGGRMKLMNELGMI